MFELFIGKLRRLLGMDCPQPPFASPAMGRQRSRTCEPPPPPIANSDDTRTKSGQHRKSIEADEAAHQFVNWVLTQGLDFEPWAVDEIWHRVEKEFVPTHDYQLPPQDKFLHALKRVPTVRFQHDKRIRRRPRK